MELNGIVRMSRKVFELKNNNEWDLSVLSAISTMPYPVNKFDKEKIRFMRFSANTILDRLGLTHVRNNHRHLDKIKESITNLINNKVIVIEREINNSYEGYQVLNSKGSNAGYLTFFMDEYLKVTDNLKPAELVKSLACYVSICNRVSINFGDIKDVEFMSKTELMRHVSFESLESIGGRYGKTKKSVSNSVKNLVLYEVISMHSVTTFNGKSVKSQNYYSPYRLAKSLDRAVELIKNEKNA